MAQDGTTKAGTLAQVKVMLDQALHEAERPEAGITAGELRELGSWIGGAYACADELMTASTATHEGATGE